MDLSIFGCGLSFALAVGTILPSWDALEAVIEDHSITKKIAFFCCPKDQARANYICRQKDECCSFRAYASLNSEGEIKNSVPSTIARVPLTTANTQS